MRPNDNRLSREHQLSSEAEIAELHDALVSHLKAFRYPSRDIYAIQLAVEEAVVNAILHGNQSDPSKRVKIAFELDEQALQISIEDEGNGFCPHSVADPTLAEHIDRPGGRGLLFMRNFMCSVEYNDRGNRLTMSKQRSPVNGSAAESESDGDRAAGQPPCHANDSPDVGKSRAK